MSDFGLICDATWKADARRRGCRFVALVLLAANAMWAFPQTIRRPPLVFGSGTVELIARVESLSVTAAQGTAGEPAVTGEAAALQPVSITASWAVPANFTTFRLTQYFGGRGTMAAVQAGGGRSTGEAWPSGGEGVSAVVLESGQTNEARTRTYVVDAIGILQKHADIGGQLNILVQAL